MNDANKAGSRESKDCTLILTEGDSAKSMVMSARNIIGSEKYGIFPLRGKLLNVREANSKQLLENNPLCWETDVEVRTYLYNNFNVKNLLKMKEISKPRNEIIDNPWFIYSKLNKFDNLTRVYKSSLT